MVKRRDEAPPLDYHPFHETLAIIAISVGGLAHEKTLN
jgi:hypothetical protein